MKTKSRTRESGQPFTALVAAGLLVVAMTGTAAAQDSASGAAFGGAANAAGAAVGPTPLATLPADGGMTAAEAASLSVPNVLATDALRAITAGAIGGVQSLTTVQNVNILNGLVTARLAVPIASSTADGIPASSDATGSALIGLVVNGVPLGDGPFAPNTAVDIPGVGTLIVNEQRAGGDGLNSSSLTVNMLHLVLTDPVTGAKTGDIVVGSASSGVSMAPFVPAHIVPVSGCVFYTGGGRIDAITPQNRQDFGTFGFNATTRNSPNGCGPRGQLEYHDHNPNIDLNIHGVSADIDGEDTDPQFGGMCALFHGTARVRRGNTTLTGPNADGTFDYSARACDNGEPGVGRDKFNIVVPGVYDSTCAPESPACGGKDLILRGGNIQRHAH